MYIAYILPLASLPQASVDHTCVFNDRHAFRKIRFYRKFHLWLLNCCSLACLALGPQNVFTQKANTSSSTPIAIKMFVPMTVSGYTQGNLESQIQDL